MPIEQTSPACKAARDRLPDRRLAISTSFERDGARFEMTAGYYRNGMGFGRTEISPEHALHVAIGEWPALVVLAKCTAEGNV
jgi:hypothetical protein